MCGRFAIKATWEELEDWYNILGDPDNPFPPNFNVSPTDPIPIIGRFDEGDKKKNRWTFARWGLVPFWWKKPLNELPSSINARAESVRVKPFYRAAFRYRRCLIPVSGFYEWKGTKSPKQPFYISGVNEPIITFAGLYEEWIEPASGTEIVSATIVTTQANNFMRSIHKRMPVILARENFDQWLTEEGDELLQPAPENYLHAWPVSTRVNSVRYNGPDCIEPASDGQDSLF